MASKCPLCHKYYIGEECYGCSGKSPNNTDVPDFIKDMLDGGAEDFLKGFNKKEGKT